jgi:nitrite reductase (NADH) small subunit/3-phenylpropionate/trans-cinnamate dioxygenase ferredoxin subunit
MSGFVRVGKTDDFPRERGRMVRVDGVPVAVFRRGDRWFALQDSCPHMGASLADGKLEGGCVVCHWHEWKFELESGQGEQRSWARAKVYRVKVEKGDVLIEAPIGPASQSEPTGDDVEWIPWDDKYLK